MSFGALILKNKTGELIMNERMRTDPNTFAENINKKSKKHNGKRVRFSWLKRKRK